MGRFHLTIATAALLAVAALTANASATCPKSESFFGVIQRVNGNVLTVSTEQNHWADIRVAQDARVNTNGTAMRPGTFVGAYGCVEPSGVFDASEVTLSPSSTAYHESLSGVVQRVASNRLTVRESGNRWVDWFVPDADRFHVGQQISGVGMVGANGFFYPQTLNGENIAFEPTATTASQPASTITRAGVVRQVRPDALIVWEPTNHTTGMWMVRDADRFRIGERVVARGTEDRSGRFYPVNISVH